MPQTLVWCSSSLASSRLWIGKFGLQLVTIILRISKISETKKPFESSTGSSHPISTRQDEVHSKGAHCQNIFFDAQNLTVDAQELPNPCALNRSVRISRSDKNMSDSVINQRITNEESLRLVYQIKYPHNKTYSR